jgi:DNA-binding NarL/FixJ family response regulator
MNATRCTALIADDEPLLREELTEMLAQAWPELAIVAQARNGRQAVEMFEVHQPDICFLDVHMPGLSGVEAARQIGNRAHLVFVTAFDRHAFKAFDTHASDFLLKPVEPERLGRAIERLRAASRSSPRPRAGGPPAHLLRSAARRPRHGVRAHPSRRGRRVGARGVAAAARQERRDGRDEERRRGAVQPAASRRPRPAPAALTPRAAGRHAAAAFRPSALVGRRGRP